MISRGASNYPAFSSSVFHDSVSTEALLGKLWLWHSENAQNLICMVASGQSRYQKIRLLKFNNSYART